MVSDLINGSIDMPFWIVSAAKSHIDHSFGIFFTVPAAQLRLYLLSLVDSQLKDLEFF